MHHFRNRSKRIFCKNVCGNNIHIQGAKKRQQPEQIIRMPQTFLFQVGITAKENTGLNSPVSEASERPDNGFRILLKKKKNT